MPIKPGMHRHLSAGSLPFLLAFSALAAAAQEPPETKYETKFDYDVPVADVPIESKVFGPRLTFTSPSGGVTVFYGQFNLAYQSFDDGQQTTSNIVDNGNWNSRLGFTFTQPFGENTFRARFESGLTLRNSSLVSQTETPHWDQTSRTLLRWFEVALDSNYGTVSLGQGATAANGTTGLDDSFTFIAGATDSTDGFASFRFRNDAGELTRVSIGQVNSALDALRRFRARYDTPVFSGVMLSASYGKNVLVTADKNDYYDAAIRWTGDVGDIAVRSALGYQWIDHPDGGGRTERLAGSVSLLHKPTGLNFAVSAGDEKDGPSYYWTRAGWRTNPLAVGTTSLSIDYYNGRDFLSNGSKTENYGVYAVQDIDSLSLNLYVGWRRFKYSDQLGNSYQDADGILAGVRWFF
jgi:hypothetical protein